MVWRNGSSIEFNNLRNIEALSSLELRLSDMRRISNRSWSGSKKWILCFGSMRITFSEWAYSNCSTVYRNFNSQTRYSVLLQCSQKRLIAWMLLKIPKSSIFWSAKYIILRKKKRFIETSNIFGLNLQGLDTWSLAKLKISIKEKNIVLQRPPCFDLNEIFIDLYKWTNDEKLSLIRRLYRVLS